MEHNIAIIGAAIAFASAMFSLVSAVFTFNQAKAAKESLRQASISNLFSAFDTASKLTITKPELLYSVHGLDKSVSNEEATNIAYFSLLMDAFQHYHGEKYNGDFTKMENEYKIKSTFLNRILSLAENQNRWRMLKNLYYGELDARFIKAIEALMEHENNKKHKAQS